MSCWSRVWSRANGSDRRPAAFWKTSILAERRRTVTRPLDRMRDPSGPVVSMRHWTVTSSQAHSAADLISGPCRRWGGGGGVGQSDLPLSSEPRREAGAALNTYDVSSWSCPPSHENRRRSAWPGRNSLEDEGSRDGDWLVAFESQCRTWRALYTPGTPLAGPARSSSRHPSKPRAAVQRGIPDV